MRAVWKKERMLPRQVDTLLFLLIGINFPVKLIITKLDVDIISPLPHSMSYFVFIDCHHLVESC